MATSEYPKTFVRNGVSRHVGTPADEVTAKCDGFTEKKARTQFSGEPFGDAS